MARREFTKAVKVEIIKRASWGYGTVDHAHCENCGQTTRQFEIDHRIPDALQTDKTARLTASDGWLLCIPCHKAKTAQDVPDIAKAKRREAAHLGARRRPKQPVPSGPSTLRGPERTHESRTALPPRQLFEDRT